MFIITSDKVFVKKAKKLVIAKDFVIADATDDYDSELSDFGNRTQCAEFVPTPVLRKISTDPDSAESKIKARNINTHLRNWLQDDGFNMRLLFFIDMMCSNYERCSEDINVFIVLRKADYREYAGHMRDAINEYAEGFDMVRLIGPKTEKSERKEILAIQRPREFWGKVRKWTEKRRKDFDKSTLAQIYHEHGA